MNEPLDNRSPTQDPYQQDVWIWTDGQVGGPFPFTDVRALVVSGEAPPGLLARKENGEWLPWPEFAEKHGPASRRTSVPAEPTPAQEDGVSKASDQIHTLFVVGVLGIGIIALVLLMVAVGSGTTASTSPEADRDTAYRAAVEILKAEIPGLRSISPSGESRVSQAGNIWTVDLVVDGVNAFGGPVRRSFTVRMESGAGSFYRVAVVQGPPPTKWAVPIR